MATCQINTNCTHHDEVEVCQCSGQQDADWVVEVCQCSGWQDADWVVEVCQCSGWQDADWVVEVCQCSGWQDADWVVEVCQCSGWQDADWVSGPGKPASAVQVCRCALPWLRYPRSWRQYIVMLYSMHAELRSHVLPGHRICSWLGNTNHFSLDLPIVQAVKWGASFL